MAVEEIAAAHARRQVTLARRAARELARLWRLVDRGNVAASWRELLPAALAVVSASQAAAASQAGPYVAAVADEYDVASVAAGRVNPGAFAGIASDGRPLASLLYEPAITSLVAIRQGAAPARAMMSGGFLLDMVARTQVADAGRTADGAALVAHPQMTGYIRMIVGKTCSRCVVLAGRRYRWNTGFLRHPRCDCRHVPVTEDVPGDVRTDPTAYFRSLTPAEQDKTFTKAGAETIRDGADIARVVNARRGIQEAGGRLFTTEAAGRRPRLMPEQIYRDARDRDDAVRLLRLHRYILRPGAMPVTTP